MALSGAPVQDAGLVRDAASQAKTRRRNLRSIKHHSAAMVAVLVTGILMMTVGPTTLARTAVHCQPTFRGELRILPSHAGRGSRHVGNDVCTQTHRIRGACLPSRVLSGRTVRVKSKRAGQQCKRARQMDITHVVTPALRVILSTC